MTRKDALIKFATRRADQHSDILNIIPCEPYEREANARFDAYRKGFRAAVDLLLPSVVALDFIKTVVEETGNETTTELECHHSAENALTTLDAELKRIAGDEK